MQPQYFVGQKTGKPAEVFPNQENFIEAEGFIARLHGESRKGGFGHEILTAVKDQFAAGVNAIFVGNALLALLLSGLLQYMMDFLSILQLMVMPVLFQIAHPANS